MLPRSGSMRVPALPISNDEFFNSLSRVLSVGGRLLPPKPARIGIAVSGGVDSMALAFLCKALDTFTPARKLFDFVWMSFIVNHNAREGSGDEADLVRRRLHHMGLCPRVLPLTWPSNHSPPHLSDFETQARHLRYRALGTACRDSQLSILLLAHHEDDQVETVLMRLASGHKGLGLQGIRDHGTIPECWGLHGVCDSGQYERAFHHSTRRERKREDLSPPHSQRLKQIIISDWPLENGGVEVYRPLLSFSKERLVATCRAHSVGWEEDETNKDIWRTPRNAIRELLQSSRLPLALGNDSMLALAQRKGDEFRRLTAFSAILFSYSEIMLFDARSGGLVVRLPKKVIRSPETVRETENRVSYRREARLSTAFLLKRLVELVTPQESVSLHSLHFAVISIFPELGNSSDEHTNAKLQLGGFTACGVHFRRLSWPLSNQRPHPGGNISNNDLNPDFVWKLTRQPYSHDRPILKIPPSSSTSRSLDTGDFPPPDTYPMPRTSPWSPWQLWDGRYWIRVLNCTSRALDVRPLQPSDLQSLRSTISKGRHKALREVLALAAPNNVRWTLMAIVEEAEEPHSLGKVLALPTLGPEWVFNTEDEQGNRKVEWEVRYKRVSLDFRVEDSNGSRKTLSRSRDLINIWKS